MIDSETKKELMFTEALERMNIINFLPAVREDFKKSKRLYYSERSPLGGILYWLDNNPEWAEKVKQIEEKLDILVYHVTHEYTQFGELLTLLCVTSYEEEWVYERNDLRDKVGNKFYAFAYVLNLDCPEYSEFGTVVMREGSGGLIREG